MGTQDNSGVSLVDYSVVLRRVFQDSNLEPRCKMSHLLGVGLSWRQKDNIIHRDLRTAQKIIKGSIYQLETEFPMPPAYGFAPKYVIHADFKRSMASQLMSRVVCSEVSCEPGTEDGACGSGPARTETLYMEPSTPLRDYDNGDGSDGCILQ